MHPSHSACPRPRRAELAWAIGTVLAVKFLALAAIWSLWFAHPQASPMNDPNAGNGLYPPHRVVQKGAQPDAQP